MGKLGRRPHGSGRKVYYSVGLSPEAAECYRRAAARMGVKPRALVERAAQAGAPIFEATHYTVPPASKDSLDAPAPPS